MKTTFYTSIEDTVIEPFPNHALKTVANFVDPATSAKEWVDPIPWSPLRIYFLNILSR